MKILFVRFNFNGLCSIGLHDKTEQVKDSRNHKIISWCRTPEWNIQNLKHDIAVVYVKPPFNLAAKEINAIELNKDDDIEVGTLCQIFGWGLVYSNGKRIGPSSRYIKGTSLPIRNVYECKKNYAAAYFDLISYNGHICAGLKGIDSCSVSVKN